MKFITLALILAISNPVFADEAPNPDKKTDNKPLKGRVIRSVVVVVALAGFVGYRIVKTMKKIKAAEALGRRSRMLSSRFTSIKITNPPLYRLTAPDGSQHHILGTWHVPNLSLNDFPKNSEVFKILNEANILMPEKKLYTPFAAFDAYKANLFTIPSRLKSRLRFLIWKLRYGRSLPLSEELGEQHWAKLTHMLEEKPDIRPVEQTIDEFMEEFDKLTPGQAYDRLMKYGVDYVVPDGSLHMDGQLIRLGMKEGKKLIGLETFSQTTPKVAAHWSRVGPYKVDDLKSLIDKGGIDYVADSYEKILRLYATGKDLEAVKIVNTFTGAHRDGFDAYDNYMLDQRNIAWVESGKIQKNCVSGNKCLIFVGDGHLTEGKNTLIKLLEAQGYHIERISAKASDF